MTSSIVISGAVILDGRAATPITGADLWIEGARIKAIGRPEDLNTPSDVRRIDARGQFVMPGFMNANVHLLLDMRLENLVRFEGRYEHLILEAAQIALRNGQTTVFDTWGPRGPLMRVRDQIEKGDADAARIFCAGNIVGLDGPFSPDFQPKAQEVASSILAERINAVWVENVGPGLTWMTPEAVAQEIRAYIETGIDFLKYASSEHLVPMGPTAFLAFSPRVQRAIIAEAHSAGLTAQAHTTSVEALHASIEAGADIIQHANSTGPTPIPDDTFALMRERGTACTVFPLTRKRMEFLRVHGDAVTKKIFTDVSTRINIEGLVKSGVPLLLANDGGIFGHEMASDPVLGAAFSGEENLFNLELGHFTWLKAMEENGMSAMDGLKAATYNIAVAYRKDKDLGSLEPGKIADLVVLDKDPMQSAAHYQSVALVMKSGRVVDREALPRTRTLTRAPDAPSAEVLAYRRNRHSGGSGLPCC